ncbi:protocatechuate 3,4-dioxygenase subunit beta [Povalibacter sp.]|uniref:protocatechuate 3,4-dioxygenase subunit beta n=1 Tax=Povalibacter sp. TaxID=1962978 RepID=UPI002F41A7F0
MKPSHPYPLESLQHDPPYLHPDYVSTRTRAPREPLIVLPQALSELTGPVFGHSDFKESDADLTVQGAAQPIGERIVVHGRLVDDRGRAIPNSLIEIWQANSTGRYRHARDQHDAPLDPNFFGAGRCMTDAEGCYRFVTIRPGSYPWGNHPNAWRPAHIHFSLFGPCFLTRLVTQMYFPGDPLFPFDPIFHSVTDARARERMVAKFDLEATLPNRALGFRFDIVLRGPDETPLEEER